MMGSEEHVLNKKLISGSVRTANGAHMKMFCEGDINVDVITKNGDIASATLRVKVILGMKQRFFSFTQAMLGGWVIQGGQTNQGKLFIALTHKDHKPLIFDRVLKAGNSVLLAAKMVIKNPEEVNTVIVKGKQSKEYFHKVTHLHPCVLHGQASLPFDISRAHNRKYFKRTLSRLLAVALRMYLTLHLQLFAQSM